MTFAELVHEPQRLNPVNCGDLLVFHLSPHSVQNVLSRTTFKNHHQVVQNSTATKFAALVRSTEMKSLDSINE